MLELKGIVKVFNPGSINEKVALDGVDLFLQPGDFVTIIGSNGAGKSTLLNAVAGVFPVDKGSIILEGNDITRYPEHLRAAMIGRVFQDPLRGTAAEMTIEENLAIAFKRGEKRRLRRAITRREREIFREKLRALGLGLEERLTVKVGLLSGGQRQALTLLMATLKEPKLLLLDEHTAALDPKTARKVLALTEEIVEEKGLTTLMVTHNLDQALNVGNRTIMMHEGKIILDLMGAERERTTVSDLLQMFEKASGQQLHTDRLLLA
ncbi:ABC transporter ATP-binding protein [Calderihabitans maritimus]|uniref:Phosphonate-transporting ATPase n=1 Tax=Calderihabitans maritimus TaxID=1246530 RepID=A0A1Z5HQL8_9FIRM|nr:ATP-binding cassette domain-containing protein [Calderihabitans maritimus]GAW91819.1 phosphonate-transporting ATPase [Calderihabitans maritimus]